MISVEFIIGLNGSTMGCLVCFIFPALFYLKVMEAKEGGKIMARVGTNRYLLVVARAAGTHI